MDGAYPFQQQAESFWDDRSLGSNIDTVSDNGLRETTNLFNFGWIGAYSDKFAVYMMSVSGAQLVNRHQELRLFSIDRPRTDIWGGKRTVLSTAADRVVIKALSGVAQVLVYQ